MFKEFKEFAIKGNATDMAVGIMIGGAFSGIIQSLVNDVLMPPLGLLTGGLDFKDKFLLLKAGATPEPYASLAAAKTAGATVLAYGNFINVIVSFLIIAFVLFMLVRGMNRMRRAEAPPAPATKTCAACKSTVALDATRCAYCTSDLR